MEGKEILEVYVIREVFFLEGRIDLGRFLLRLKIWISRYERSIERNKGYLRMKEKEGWV